MNKKVILEAIYSRTVDIFERTKKWKKNTPAKTETKNELVDLCEAYFEIKGNTKIIELENKDIHISTIKALVDKW